MLYLSNFKVKEGKFNQFQAWIKVNEKTLANLAQKVGWKYLGTFYYALGTGGQANGCFLHEFQKYGDIDKSRDLFGDPTDEKIGKALMDLLASDPMHDRILRPIGEAQVYKFV
ncbi:MAG TPA: hypothetical protein VJ529_04935 [Candidatus Bathyarchaeia archaeon]|nr:hypothetical protein [Candidatus Bathyarchaeia archaeon]